MTTAGVVLVVPGVVEDDGVEEDEVREARAVVIVSRPLVFVLETGEAVSTASFTETDSITVLFGGRSELCAASAMIENNMLAKINTIQTHKCGCRYVRAESNV